MIVIYLHRVSFIRLNTESEFGEEKYRTEVPNKPRFLFTIGLCNSCPILEFLNIFLASGLPRRHEFEGQAR